MKSTVKSATPFPEVKLPSKCCEPAVKTVFEVLITPSPSLHANSVVSKIPSLSSSISTISLIPSLSESWLLLLPLSLLPARRKSV